MAFNGINERDILLATEPRVLTPNAQRQAHLKMLARRRAEMGPATLGGFAYCALSIPELDYRVLLQRFPELNSKDHEEKRKAWLKFAKSPESKPYRVDDSIGKRKPNTGIIVR